VVTLRSLLSRLAHVMDDHVGAIFLAVALAMQKDKDLKQAWHKQGLLPGKQGMERIVERAIARERLKPGQISNCSIVFCQAPSFGPGLWKNPPTERLSAITCFITSCCLAAVHEEVDMAVGVQQREAQRERRARHVAAAHVSAARRSNRGR